MKKILNIALVLSLIFVLTSCFTSEDDIQNVKNDLIGNEKTDDNKDKLTPSNTGSIEDNRTNEEKFQDNMDKFKEIEENVEKNKEKISVKYLDNNKFLEIDSLEGKDLLSREIEITGKTLVNVDKIVVKFSNADSNFPEDIYQLKTFKKGDKTFLYRAFSKYEVMDYGINKYIFEAYSGNSVSKLELTLVAEKEKKNIINSLVEKVSDSETVETMDANELPSSGIFGNPRNIGSGKIAYSDVKGLEISTGVNYNLELNGDLVTSFLADNAKGWFFWNTLKPISGTDKGVSFYAIRVNGEEYFYEKYYYVPSKNILGVLTLESGTGISTDELSAKNKEFKEKNDNYQIVGIADILFKEIIK